MTTRAWGMYVVAGIAGVALAVAAAVQLEAGGDPAPATPPATVTPAGEVPATSYLCSPGTPGDCTEVYDRYVEEYDRQRELHCSPDEEDIVIAYDESGEYYARCVHTENIVD